MNKVRIYEVGPRDGLQNVKAIIPTAEKIELINALSAVGFEKIEATSFVSPKWVPQLADASDVMAGISRVPGVTYVALTPNLEGFDAALACRVDEVAIFASASETFSQKNVNCSIADSLDRFVPVLAAAEKAGLPVRGYVSCVAGCPYEGDIAPSAVRIVSNQLADMGCYEISLGDTIGEGTPETIGLMLREVLKSVPSEQLAGHFHDTNNRALDNVSVCLDHGLRTFDSAVGGLGGCPYAPGAKGNLSTRKLVEMLEKAGWDTGLDMNLLARAEQLVSAMVTNNPISRDGLSV